MGAGPTRAASVRAGESSADKTPAVLRGRRRQLLTPLIAVGKRCPTSSTSNITIAAQAHVTLTPGIYGNLAVGNQAQVTLSSGAYSFSQVSLGNQVQIIGNANGVTVSVGGTFVTGSEVQINRSGTASKFAIMVGGNDSTTSAVVIGQEAQLTTLFAAPYGTMSIAAQAQLTGAFAAFDIALANQVEVTYESGFSIPTPPTQVVA